MTYPPAPDRSLLAACNFANALLSRSDRWSGFRAMWELPVDVDARGLTLRLAPLLPGPHVFVTIPAVSVWEFRRSAEARRHFERTLLRTIRDAPP